jgi:hypothetical protein
MSKRGERHRGMALRDSEASRKPGGPRHWLICSTPITMMPEHTQTARGCPRWFVHQTTRLVMNSAEGGEPLVVASWEYATSRVWGRKCMCSLSLLPQVPTGHAPPAFQR